MERKNVTWNMIGSLIYAGSSMVLTALVNHLVGPEQGGIFGFAFSTFGQQIFTVAYFGMRPIQSTDTSGSYTFGEYRMARYYTSLLAIVIGIGYILFQMITAPETYSMEKILVVFLMVLYKVLDGFADVYESEFQRGGRLYLTGKAMAYRTLFSVALFLGALAVTRHLIFACAVAVCAQGMGIILFDKRMAGKLQNIKYSREKGREWTLIRESFLLFLSVFLDVLIFSMAKYAVNANMTSIDNAIFVAIFMPTSVINLAANFVIRPFLTKMAIQWEEGRFHDLAGDLRKLMGIILFLTVIALAGAWVLGVPVLGAISNVDLVPYKSGLMMIGRRFLCSDESVLLCSCGDEMSEAYILWLCTCLYPVLFPVLWVCKNRRNQWRRLLLYDRNGAADDMLYGTGIYGLFQREKTMGGGAPWIRYL
jgi:O-antigen/teichoic acid export membrane protein